MTTFTLGLPSELRRRLETVLPRAGHVRIRPVVSVTPRDRRHRKCAAYESDYYEIQAFYTTAVDGALDRLEHALRETDGVYATTQVRSALDGRGARNTLTNPDWPHPLGTGRRGFHDLRVQVIALIHDRKVL